MNNVPFAVLVVVGVVSIVALAISKLKKPMRRSKQRVDGLYEYVRTIRQGTFYAVSQYELTDEFLDGMFDVYAQTMSRPPGYIRAIGRVVDGTTKHFHLYEANFLQLGSYEMITSLRMPVPEAQNIMELHIKHGYSLPECCLDIWEKLPEKSKPHSYYGLKPSRV